MLANQGSQQEPDIKEIVMTGIKDFESEPGRLRYTEIDTTIRAGVLENADQLVELLFNNDDLNLKNYFGIDTDMDFVRNALKKHLQDGLQEGLSKHAGSKERMEESLFFYPFVHSLYMLSKELNSTYYA